MNPVLSITLRPSTLERGLSTSMVARRIGISPRAARTRLASLVERGLVAEIGSGPQDPHRRYHLVSAGHAPTRRVVTR